MKYCWGCGGGEGREGREVVTKWRAGCGYLAGYAIKVCRNTSSHDRASPYSD